MTQSDYIMRMIQQTIQAIAHALEMARGKQPEAALQAIDATTTRVLGPRRPLAERMAPADVVAMMSPYELERVLMYAALEGARGTVAQTAGDDAAAQPLFRRALELFAHARIGGAAFGDLEREQVALLASRTDLATLADPCREALKEVLAG